MSKRKPMKNQSNGDPKPSDDGKDIADDTPLQLESEPAENQPSPAEEDLSEAEQALAEQESQAALSQELEKLQKEAQEYLDGWQRARAEFANYKKRMDREMSEIYQRLSGDIHTRYLPILDDLERALNDRPTEGEAETWAKGVELIYRKFMAILEADGVELVPTEGLLFDPNFHEALSHEESEGHQEGEIIDVLQKGYRMGDRVLRPALVRVAK